MSFTKAVRMAALIICGCLGLWLIVATIMRAAVYGRTADTPDLVFWVSLIVSLPAYFVAINPTEIIDTVEREQAYREMYMDYRDECRTQSVDIARLKADRQLLQNENAELKKKLSAPVKVRLCTKKGCGK